jgi:CRP-like cAMP-binding protein
MTLPPEPPLATRPRNHLLARLSPEEFARIQPHLSTVPMKRDHRFHHRSGPIDRVYFPNGGVVSVTVGSGAGQVVEVAVIGAEGLVGIEATFRADGGALGETMVQVPDTTSATSMSTAAFRDAMQQRSDFSDGVAAYAHAFLGATMQSTACMALHQVQERCCKWLLMVHDRLGRDEFELTQEFLAMMLATARPTVSLVARTLQEAGLIEYRYGHITIRDREGLEGSACECYAFTRELYAKLGQ